MNEVTTNIELPVDDGASDYKVPYTTILAIKPHGNAERLEVAMVYGWQVVVQKGRYKVGDTIVYVPIDSILPAKLEAKLFPEGSKIKLYHSRVRQIRIRGLASQGMIIDSDDVSDILNLDRVKLETNLADSLGITKYQPPVVGPSQTVGAGKFRNKRTDNPLFHKYNGVGNIKWFPDLFEAGELVVVQEKLHGTNCRAALLPYAPTTLWKKILKFLQLAPKYEKCYGSNNVEISAKFSYSGWYGEDLYGNTLKKMDVFSKLKPGESVYGEIVGPAIQKNYTYGLTEPKFVLFDVKRLQEDGKQVWLTPSEVTAFAKERGFDLVPELYYGPFNKEFIATLTKGNSVYAPSQLVREGVVIKSAENYSVEGNKRALKFVSEDYLDDKSNSDFH